MVVYQAMINFCAGKVNLKPTIFYLLLYSTLFSYGSRPHSVPLISGDSFRAIADHIFDETTNSFDASKVQLGDTIFINLSHQEEFFTKIHPQITSPYILISHNHDYSAPGRYTSMLEDPKLIAWFTQNPDIVNHPKLHGLPIGLSNKHWPHSRHHDAMIKQMQPLLALNIEKKRLLYVNFNVHTSPARRQPVYDFFKKLPFSSFFSDRSYTEFLKDCAESKFVLSPHGNGLDCHRTWEALYMQSIPLVKTSSLDPLYSELPVLIVNDWDEITEEFLERKYREISSKLYNYKKLYFNYWHEKIKEVQAIARTASLEQLSLESKISYVASALKTPQANLKVLAKLLEPAIEELCPQKKRTRALKEKIPLCQQELSAKCQNRSAPAPILSFVMPCYNREAVIDEAIQSIYSQNLSVPFEVIVVDDASQDGSYEKLKKYEEKYNNFFVFRHTTNKRAPATRNTAICYARGTYICNVDSDDIFEPNSIEPMLNALIERNYEIAFFQDLKFFYDQDSSKVQISPTLVPGNQIDLVSMLKKNYLSPCAGNRIFSKQSWLQVGGYLEDRGHDSWSFSFKLLANGYRSYVHPQSGYLHRLWSNKKNMWWDDMQNRVNDISPLKVVREHPEFFEADSYTIIKNYGASDGEFINVLTNLIAKNRISLVSKNQLDNLLLAYYYENRDIYTKALDYYQQAISCGISHVTVYLRAAYVAMLLNNCPAAQELLSKLCTKLQDNHA